SFNQYIGPPPAAVDSGIGQSFCAHKLMMSQSVASEVSASAISAKHSLGSLPLPRKGSILGVGEKIGYALGDSASNFYWKVFEFYLLFFYPDVLRLTSVAAGWMLLFSHIWDAEYDPLMGAIADRTMTRWDKFRPYMLWIANPIWAAG